MKDNKGQMTDIKRCTFLYDEGKMTNYGCGSILVRTINETASQKKWSCYARGRSEL